MKLFNYIYGIAVGLTCTFSLPTYAQSDTTDVDLTELSLEQLSNVTIVTASKMLQEASQAPSTVVVVTEEQIRVRGYRSLLDVLMDIPDFKIDDKVYSSSWNITTVRGIEGQAKVIVMLDGVRISSPTNESIPVMENYPVHLAKQIEIIYGPASALYGADAFSGIINIISKKSDFASSKTEVSSTLGSYGLYNGSLYTSRKIRKNTFLTIAGQYFYDKGVDMSKTFSRDSLLDMTSHSTGTFNTIYGPMTPIKPVGDKYEAPLMAYNVFARLQAGDFDFTFFTNYSQHSSAIENNTSNAVYNKDVFYGRGVTALSGRHTLALNSLTFVTTLTASQYKVNPKSNYRNMFSGMEPAYKYGYSSMIQTEEQVEWKISPKTSLVGGAVFQSFFSLPETTDLQNPVDDSGAIEGTMLNTPSFYRPEGLEAKIYAVKYYNAGGYAQIQQKFLKKSSVTAGVRYDYNSRFGSTINPRLGVVLNVTPQTTIKVMAGTAYLAPTPGSTYAYYGTLYTLDSGRTYRSNFMHLANPKLKPMVSKNAEISLRQFVGKNFSVTLAGYYTQIKGIVSNGSDEGNTNIYGGKFLGWDVDYIEVFLNEGTETAMGGSLMMAYNQVFRGGNFRTYANVSFVEGSETDFSAAGTDLPELDNIAPWMLKCGVDLIWGKFYFSPRAVWLNKQRLAGTTEIEGNTRQVLDGYTLLNMSAGYNFGKISVFGNISNALNQTYKALGPNMDLNNKNTELFYGNTQDPVRFNAGVKVGF
jgi:outer membrane cobalamin receptor